jgi:hypothetical protein
MRGQPLRLCEMIERPSPSSENKFWTRRGVRSEEVSGKIRENPVFLSPSDSATLGNINE